MMDVPVQYKKVIDKNVNILMDASEDLMAIVEELGADNFKVESTQYVVEIKQNKKKKGKLGWLRRLMKKNV